MEIIVATRNSGKLREIRRVLDLPGLHLRTFEEFEEFPEPEETGSTFEENALIKARAILELYQRPGLADDSGLLVDRLGGRPGVHSSRYAGPEGNSEHNMDRLLEELDGVPRSERTARFSCVMALIIPGGGTHLTHGECEGAILEERRGKGGFGYDPIFLPAGFDRSMAELTLDEKNSISHRGKALLAMREVLAGL